MINQAENDDFESKNLKRLGILNGFKDAKKKKLVFDLTLTINPNPSYFRYLHRFL